MSIPIISVRDTCSKTWIQDTQSSELPKNISICTFCAVHEAGVSVVENHDQSAIWSVASVAAVLHYECGRSAAPLQPHYQPVSLTWILLNCTWLCYSVIYLHYGGPRKLIMQKLSTTKQKSAPLLVPGMVRAAGVIWRSPGPAPPTPASPPSSIFIGLSPRGNKHKHCVNQGLFIRDFGYKAPSIK